MSSCEFIHKVHAYHDGELSAGARRELDEHLQGCLSCARELEQLRSMSEFFAGAAMPQMPAGVLDGLHRRLASLRGGVTVRMAKMLMASAATVLLVCSALLWQALREQVPHTSGPMPDWEMAATGSRTEELADGAEEQMAQWIVEDLSLESAHE